MHAPQSDTKYMALLLPAFTSDMVRCIPETGKVMNQQSASTKGHAPVIQSKPIIGVSRCLGFAACRWNGQCLPDPTVEALRDWVEFRTFCPEMEIGLGAPRDPIRLVGKANSPETALMQPATGRDVTREMEEYSANLLPELADASGFILKAKSPSCGLRGVKVYKDMNPGKNVDYAPGVFGRAVVAAFSELPMEDEGRLSNFLIREHFLTRIFTHARFREIMGGAMRDLVRFHSDHKYLLMAYDQDSMRRLGRITANPEGLSFVEAAERYRRELCVALRHPMRFTNAINVLLHIFGYFSDKLNSAEKAFFLDSLERYRQAKAPLAVLQGVLRSWAVRFEDMYLLWQHFFQPYPEALVEITDSGKGRDH